ncbi:MAG: hypothetical protein JJE09_10230 [Bacteroidia bacterium]|nr:hypothetical protein [Bacteroidia bacterium]
MNKKVIFLLLALMLPVLVFIFLKYFGKNEFVVAPLFQTEKVVPPTGCFEISIPYFISDSAYSFIKQGHETDSLLIIFYSGMSKDLIASDIQIARVQESFPPETGVRIKQIPQVEKLVECSLLLQSPKDLVLVDEKKRIRGQYSSNDRDEVDRLMTELDIILKRY